MSKEELPTKQDLQDTLNYLANNFAQLCESAKYDAELKKAQFDEFLVAGFSEKQALYLLRGGSYE